MSMRGLLESMSSRILRTTKISADLGKRWQKDQLSYKNKRDSSCASSIISTASALPAAVHTFVPIKKKFATGYRGCCMLIRRLTDFRHRQSLSALICQGPWNLACRIARRHYREPSSGFETSFFGNLAMANSQPV